MELLVHNDSFDHEKSLISDELIRLVSKFWSPNDWEDYLNQHEIPQPKEEIYVGTTIELEKLAAQKSISGFTPASSIEEGIEFKSVGKKQSAQADFYPKNSIKENSRKLA